MSRCARCHAQVPVEARFCSECGTWIVHSRPAAVTLSTPAPAPVASQVSPSALSVPVSAPDPGLLATAFAPPGAAGTPSPAVSSFAAGKSTDLRTVDPRTGPTFPAAAAANPAPPVPARMVTTPVFGNVQLTPIPTSGSSPPPPMPTPSSPPPAQPPPRASSPPPAPLPAVAAMPPIPSMAALPALPSRAELPASRASRTVADVVARVPPPLSIGRTPRPLSGFLVSFQYEPLGIFWPLASGANRVGRANARPDVDVAIADATISSDQALLTIDRGAASLEDRGSTNRTFVNGHPLVAGQRAAVRHGDRLRFGSYETILVLLP